MNAPFDPEETHDGPESEDPFGENSMTWGAAEPDFDRMLRERIGPPTTMPTPPYAFERVLLAGRRRRARKVWAAGAAAAIVVMAGTAGTTVALRGTPSSGVVGPAASGAQTTSRASTSPAVSASPSAPVTLTTTQTPSLAATSASPTPSDTSSSVPQCHSDDLQLTVSFTPGGNNLANLLIVLRNNSGHSCTTYGYPGLQTETVNEQLQSTKVVRQGQAQVQKLTLSQGDSISTIAEFQTVATGATPSPGADCGAASYYLAVIPPNEQTQILATIAGGPITVCDSGTMDVGSFTMGNTG